MDFKSYNTFYDFHPLVNFLYFGAVILFSMMFVHPVFLGIGVIASFVYSITLNGIKSLKFNLYFLLPMMFMVILLNPLFSHKGITILFYLNNKPITLESFIYGIATAVMIITVIMWFSCYNKVITSDKFIYMFSKISPSISLLISMTLGFVPRFKNQLKKIRTTQRNIGRDINNGTVFERAKHGCTIISILITWALENGVQTADSMRGRGYGLNGRTNFSIYKIDNRDKNALIVIITTISICLTGYVLGKNKMEFYPYISISKITVIDIVIYIAYTVLVFLPVIVEIKETLRWNSLKSKI